MDLVKVNHALQMIATNKRLIPQQQKAPPASLGLGVCHSLFDRGAKAAGWLLINNYLDV
jgi:hypothetical protein